MRSLGRGSTATRQRAEGAGAGAGAVRCRLAVVRQPRRSGQRDRLDELTGDRTGVDLAWFESRGRRLEG